MIKTSGQIRRFIRIRAQQERSDYNVDPGKERIVAGAGKKRGKH